MRLYVHRRPTQTHRPVRRFVGHGDFVKRVAVVGTTLAVTASADATVRVWDVRTAAATATLKGHRRGVEALALLPTAGDDTLALATGASDGELRTWTVRAGRGGPAVIEARVLGAHLTTVYDVVAASGVLWSASADKTVQARDLATGNVVSALEHTDWVRALALTPTGQVVTGGHDQVVRVWDAEVPFASVRPQGRRGEEGGGHGGRTEGSMAWVGDAGAAQAEAVVTSFEGHFDNVTALAVWRHVVVSASLDGTVRFWRLSSGAASAEWGAHAAGPRAPILTAEEEAELAELADL